MTEDDLKIHLDACKPTPVMYTSGGQPMYKSPQENANDAWQKLGDKMGFIGHTARPCGKGDLVFTAEPKG